MSYIVFKTFTLSSDLTKSIFQTSLLVCFRTLHNNNTEILCRYKYRQTEEWYLGIVNIKLELLCNWMGEALLHHSECFLISWTTLICNLSSWDDLPRTITYYTLKCDQLFGLYTSGTVVYLCWAGFPLCDICQHNGCSFNLNWLVQPVPNLLCTAVTRLLSQRDLTCRETACHSSETQHSETPKNRRNNSPLLKHKANKSRSGLEPRAKSADW